jgi:hypothetical protein
MAGLIQKVGSSVVDFLFGKQKTVKLGAPGQEAADKPKTSAPSPEAKREWDISDVQCDPNDPSDVTPTYQSRDKIE